MPRRRLRKTLIVVAATTGILTSALASAAHEKKAAAAHPESDRAPLSRESDIPAHATGGEPREAEHGAAPAEAESPAAGESGQHASESMLGSLHPPAVHFPIALLLSSVLAEGLLLATRDARYADASRFMLRVATVGAVVAATLGWFAGGFEPSSDDSLLHWHRWLGTSTASLTVVLLWLSERAARSGRRLAFRVALTLAGVLAAVTGFLGGELVHAAIAS